MWRACWVMWAGSKYTAGRPTDSIQHGRGYLFPSPGVMAASPYGSEQTAKRPADSVCHSNFSQRYGCVEKWTCSGVLDMREGHQSQFLDIFWYYGWFCGWKWACSRASYRQWVCFYVKEMLNKWESGFISWSRAYKRGLRDVSLRQEQLAIH